MGVYNAFRFIVGVPLEGLRDHEGAGLLKRAHATAAGGSDGEDVMDHLTPLLPSGLRAFEGGSASYGGEAHYAAGVSLASLPEVKGAIGLEVAGPITIEAIEDALHRVEEATRHLPGAERPRGIILCLTF